MGSTTGVQDTDYTQSKLGSLVAQMVKNPLLIWEMWIQSPFQRRKMATHSSTLAWKMPWREEPDRLYSVGLQRVRHNRATDTFTKQAQFQPITHLFSK